MPIACADSDRGVCAGSTGRPPRRQCGQCPRYGDNGCSLWRWIALAARGLSLILVSAAAIPLPVIRQAKAATINVPGGTD